MITLASAADRTARQSRPRAHCRRQRSAWLFLLLCAAACTSPVKSFVDADKLQHVHTVALVPPLIGPLDHCVFPLIDAAIARSRTNGISPQIVDAERAIIADYAATLNARLRSDLGFDVRPMLPDTAAAASTTAAAATDTSSPGPRFPVVCDRDRDPLGLAARRVIDLEDVDLRQPARSLCAQLGVEAIAVSYTTLEVRHAVLLQGSRLGLNSWLHVLDKDGNYVIRARFYSDPSGFVSPSDSAAFTRMLRLFDPWIEKLIADIRGKVQPKRA